MVLAPHIYAVSFLAACCFSWLLTRWVRNRANAHRWAQGPVLDRHVHRSPVPRLGGVAIYLSFMLVVLGVLLISAFRGVVLPSAMRFACGILGPATIILILGLYDDLQSASPSVKFTIQGLAAVLLYLGGFGIHQFDLLSTGHVQRTIIGLPLTVLWVLLVTNAFNLIDGLDGLAAGSALFSAIIMFVVSLLRHTPLVSVFTIALAGAILGFLRYNFNPATIFLGDCGSLFIGFILSALALGGSQKATTMVAISIPVVSFGLPILDVALSVVRRFVSGKPLFEGDGDHIHHKLLKRGLSQRNAVLVLYAVTATFGLLSLILLHGEGMIALVLVVIGLGVWFGIQQLRYAEFSELAALAQGTLQSRCIIANNLRVRRATELLTSCEDFAQMCQTLRDTLRPLGFDGFILRNPQVEDAAAVFCIDLQRARDGGLRYCWNACGSSEAGWELKFDLMTSSGDRWGQFSVFRESLDEPLLLDINLLNGRFRIALSDALCRAVTLAQFSAKDLGAEVAARGTYQLAGATSAD